MSCSRDFWRARNESKTGADEPDQELVGKITQVAVRSGAYCYAFQCVVTLLTFHLHLMFAARLTLSKVSLRVFPIRWTRGKQRGDDTNLQLPELVFN